MKIKSLGIFLATAVFGATAAYPMISNAATRHISALTCVPETGYEGTFVNTDGLIATKFGAGPVLLKCPLPDEITSPRTGVSYNVGAYVFDGHPTSGWNVAIRYFVPFPTGGADWSSWGETNSPATFTGYATIIPPAPTWMSLYPTSPANVEIALPPWVTGANNSQLRGLYVATP